MNINKIKGKIRMTTTEDNEYSPIYKKGEYFKYEGGKFVNGIFKWYDGGFYITKVEPITIEYFLPMKKRDGMKYSGFYLNKEQETEYLQLLRDEKINSILLNVE